MNFQKLDLFPTTLRKYSRCSGPALRGEVRDLLGDFSRRRILFGGRVRGCARGIQYGTAYRDRNCLRAPRRLYSCRKFGRRKFGRLRGLSGERQQGESTRPSVAVGPRCACDYATVSTFPASTRRAATRVAHRSVPTRPRRSTPNPRGPIELKMRCPSGARLIPRFRWPIAIRRRSTVHARAITPSSDPISRICCMTPRCAMAIW